LSGVISIITHIRSHDNFFDNLIESLAVADIVMNELPIIQKTYDLIQWYVPILNRLPRDHRFNLGDRIIRELYTLLEDLITARYAAQKLTILKHLNTKLDILRYQTRLLLDFQLVSAQRYEHAGKQLHEIGTELGGWIKQQTQPLKPPILQTP
jgi:23S rRNA-intervening sequence protein